MEIQKHFRTDSSGDYYAAYKLGIADYWVVGEYNQDNIPYYLNDKNLFVTYEVANSVAELMSISYEEGYSNGTNANY